MGLFYIGNRPHGSVSVTAYKILYSSSTGLFDRISSLLDIRLMWLTIGILAYYTLFCDQLTEVNQDSSADYSIASIRNYIPTKTLHNNT